MTRSSIDGLGSGGVVSPPGSHEIPGKLIRNSRSDVKVVAGIGRYSSRVAR